ncbi:MAG: hypothetical protein GX759_01335 [Thermoanaerobacterales bacterium]|nr:hypothetical protein [Thermoanaerobacterales bacterium]
MLLKSHYISGATSCRYAIHNLHMGRVIIAHGQSEPIKISILPKQQSTIAKYQPYAVKVASYTCA